MDITHYVKSTESVELTTSFKKYLLILREIQPAASLWWPLTVETVETLETLETVETVETVETEETEDTEETEETEETV